jgi:hypothetical protein
MRKGVIKKRFYSFFILFLFFFYSFFILFLFFFYSFLQERTTTHTYNETSRESKSAQVRVRQQRQCVFPDTKRRTL